MKLLLLGVTALATAIPAAPRAQEAHPGPAGGTVVIASPAQAVTAALVRSPALRGALAARQAIGGDRLQAGLYPNPDVSALGEDFGGSRSAGARAGSGYRGTGALQSTLSSSQRVELGGKRGARIGLADRGLAVADLDYRAARLTLARDVAALAGVVAVGRALEIERERVRLSSTPRS